MGNQLTIKFQDALILANSLHHSQFRKGSGVPYVSHLLAVCALVMEDGGNETEAIAALLHDAVEDQGGQATLHLINERFGHAVAEIVQFCSDTDRFPKPPWKRRKKAFLDRLPTANPEAMRVVLADKLHNLQSIHLEYKFHGDEIWELFRGGKDGTLWYHSQLAGFFSRLPGSSLRDRYLVEYSSFISVLDTSPGVEPFPGSEGI